MSRYLDPTNDMAFRKLFGTEDHKPLLISFLNAILDLKGQFQIREVVLLPKDQAPLIKDAKSTIVDVKCTDERGVQYIVEMQNRKYPFFIKRTQFYTAHSYIAQASSGSGYLSLNPVILLAITNHVLFPQKEEVVSYHKTLDIKTLENDLQEMNYVFIELPKFSKNERKLDTLQDKWIYFFRNWEKSQDIPSEMREPELIEAYHAMEQFNWSKGELEAYLKANIAITDEYSALQQEREKGEAKGKAEGKAEEQERIALELLQIGLSPLQISRVTGLTEEKLSSLGSFEISAFPLN